MYSQNCYLRVIFYLAWKGKVYFRVSGSSSFLFDSLQASVWGAPVPRGPSAGRPTSLNQSGAFFSGPVQEDPQDAMNKKKRKKKMQKVDPSILGFSVNAADRVNMGEIQTVEDEPTQRRTQTYNESERASEPRPEIVRREKNVLYLDHTRTSEF